MSRTTSQVPRVQRFPFRTALRFGPTGTLLDFGDTVDLSPAGLGVESIAPPEPGTRLTMRIPVPDGEGASVEGVVAWRQPPERGGQGRFGVRLIVADAAYLRLVAQVASRGRVA